MARIADSIVGHNFELQKLMDIKLQNRWPHAFLFVGPSGIGKMKVALAMAQSLVCENSVDGCGQCGPCLRIEKKQSESLMILSPDQELAKPVIKVEKVREVLDSLSLAQMGKARVVIIEDAHLMNPQASNALLKTLEEPTESVYFILLAPDVHHFLPTIRSRTQALRFKALSLEQLQSIKPNLPNWVYTTARGQAGKIESLTSKEGEQKRQMSFELFNQFCNDKEFLLDKEWRDPIKDRSWAVTNLQYWLLLVRDALVLKSNSKEFILNLDQKEYLQSLVDLSSAKLSTSKLSWLSKKIIIAENQINSNLDPVLVMEDMWVQYARVD